MLSVVKTSRLHELDVPTCSSKRFAMSESKAPTIDATPDAFNNFAIDGEVLGPHTTYMMRFFMELALMGDGRRVFVARGVCKKWKKPSLQHTH